MPNYIQPHIFEKIVFLAVTNQMAADALALGEWWYTGGKETVINGAVQYASYVAVQTVAKAPPTATLLPFLSNPKVAYDFITCSDTMASQPDKAVLVALMFSAAGLLTKVGDVSTNFGMGSFLAAFVQYMIAASSGLGSAAFIFAGLNRRGRRLFRSRKQEFIVELVIICGRVFLIITMKKVLQFYKRLLVKSWKLGKSVGQKIKNRKNIKHKNDLLLLEKC